MGMGMGMEMEMGMGTRNGESLKVWIFKMMNLWNGECALKAGIFKYLEQKDTVCYVGLMSALLIIRSQIFQLVTFSTFSSEIEKTHFMKDFYPGENHDNMKVSELQIWNNDDINIISNIIYDM